MGFNKVILFAFIVFFCAYSKAQELPPIQNYLPQDYRAENQNWAVSQSPEKLIYVANNKGLLEFNGSAWNFYNSPNESVIRSVKVVGDRVYTGCYKEFGYWQKDVLGVMRYTSISQQIDVKLIEDEEFWNIIDINDQIVFQSLNRIHIYSNKDGSVNTIDPRGTITKIFQVDRSIYFQVLNKGLFRIEFGKNVLITADEIIKSSEIVNLFSTDKDLLILTRANGFYSLQNKKLIKWIIPEEKLLSEVSIYNAIRLRDNSFVLGTISHGLIHLNSQGGLLYQIDQSKGLLNNTVLSLYEDDDDNIWLGLDNGISYINLNSPFKIFNDNMGVLGSVYTSAIHNENLYLGTNQGLFYKKKQSNEDFKFIQGTQGQVWFLENINETLFCGHHSGTFSVDNDRVKKISNVAGTWKINKLKDRPNLLLQGNYDGLYVLKNVNGNWQLRNKIKGFNNSSRYFEIMDNEVFVNHEYNGVFKVTIDSEFLETKDVIIDTTIKGSNSGLIKYDDELLFAYKKGILKYDRLKNKFIKDSLLSTLFEDDEYVSGKMIFDKKNHYLWVFTNSDINFVSQEMLTNTSKINKIPLSKEERNSISGYENVMNFGRKSTYLFGTNSGYITVDIGNLYTKDFQVHVDYITNGSNRRNKEAVKFVNSNLEGTFKSAENNLNISFYAPEFNKFLKPKYQFQLLGIYDDWSDWSESPTAVFENLPFGDYTFNVRSRIGNEVSANTASYFFEIQKPWYFTHTMLAIYVLATILFSIFMHVMYKRYYKKKQQELIEINKKELELTRVQNEREIIGIKNDQLRQEFKVKNKELAASTIELAKKNELLNQIKNQLAKISDIALVKPVIDIIDRNLDHNDNWEMFKEAFDNVDRKFLKKLKKTHPNLSPNDLKLCAYLRLNLSSKEIAPLFNISARSVEIKRYRLRKKLNLQHEENLVNYILEL
ncbi:triple tyrosine motif-containing protein [Aquimarina sp. SS2-1]|uniref:helix-turn-helix and ligand-binding sensor domain-containing protein n=1 Tax=Aquimarina besae TaxID=3342247 RepID=UPI00366FC296